MTAEHVLVDGTGFYAGTVVCETCHRCMLPEGVVAHCTPRDAVSDEKQSSVVTDPRESQITWTGTGGDAA